MDYKNKILSAFFILIAGMVLFLKPNFSLVDKYSNKFIDNSIKKILISYSVIRTINAGVSVIKHSAVDMQPGGIGISVGAGEILDPIDDLTERVSNLLFISIIVFGALEVLFSLSIDVFYILFPIALLLFSFGFLFETYKKKLFYFGWIIFFIAFIRFFFVFIALGDEFINFHFQKEIQATQNELKVLTPKNIEFSIPQTSGSLIDTLKNKMDYVKLQAKNIKEMMDILQKNLSNIVNNLMKLAYLYFGILITDIFLVPFLIYILFRKMLKVFYEST